MLPSPNPVSAPLPAQNSAFCLTGQDRAFPRTLGRTSLQIQTKAEILILIYFEWSVSGFRLSVGSQSLAAYLGKQALPAASPYPSVGLPGVTGFAHSHVLKGETLCGT